MANRRQIRRAIAGGLVAGLLTGCAVAPPPPQSQPTPDVAAQRRAQQQAQREAEQALRAQQLREWLASAQTALADDRLMYPQYDSAFYWYRQVLDIDELNEEAHWGMQQITARYLVLAEQAFSSGRLELAEQMLSGAERIAASPAVIAGLRQRYREQVADNRFYLAPAELAARSEKSQQQLIELARQIKPQQRLLIVARNDAEGRWIYQQMRSAVEAFRLRGNIELGKVPRVIIIDL